MHNYPQMKKKKRKVNPPAKDPRKSEGEKRKYKRDHNFRTASWQHV